MPIQVWVTEPSGTIRKYLTSVLHLSSGAAVIGDDSGATGVLPVNTGSTPRPLYITFDGQPNVELGPGHSGKVLPLGFAGKIAGVRLTSDIACNATVSIWRDNISNSDPTIADDITGGNPPALVSSQYFSNFTLTGWSKSFSKDDVWMVKIQSIDVGVKYLQLLILLEPS